MKKDSLTFPKTKQPRHYIKQWREKRGLTQERLASRAGVSVGLISQIETGHTRYSQPTLEALAVAMDCRPGDLLSTDPTKEGLLVDLVDLARRKGEQIVINVLHALPDRTDSAA